MASSSQINDNSNFPFPSPNIGPFQRTTLARILKIEDSLKDTMQMLMEIQVA